MKSIQILCFTAVLFATFGSSSRFTAQAEAIRRTYYQYYELRQPLEYKKLILPVGSKVYTDEPCNIKWEWTCRLKNMPASDKISEIRFPEGTTWADFPIGSIRPYYNRAYKGFEFSHYFGQRFSWFYADHTPSARWLNEYVRYSLKSFDTVDNEDWRFNPANLKFPADANHINANEKQRLRTDLDKLPVQGLACCDVSARKHSDGTPANQWQ